MEKKEPRRGLMTTPTVASELQPLPGMSVRVVCDTELDDIRREIEDTGVKPVQLCARASDVSDSDRAAYSPALLARLTHVRCQECDNACLADPAAGPGLEYVTICCIQCLPIVAFREQLKQMGA